MYANLKTEMSISKISIEQIAEFLGIHRNSVSKKINKGSFSVDEAFGILEHFFPEQDAQYLFKKTVRN